jgi:hypothetical protein
VLPADAASLRESGAKVRTARRQLRPFRAQNTEIDPL